MSFIRIIGKISGGLLFALFLSAAIAVQALVQVTEYSNLKTALTTVLLSQIPAAQLTEVLSILKQECAQQDSVQFTYENQTFALDCDKIKQQATVDINVVAGELFDKIYYKNYDCSFINCLQQPGEQKLLVLFSVTANSFFRGIQLIAWVGAAVGAIIMLLANETWEGRLRIFGISMLFIGLPFFLVNYVKGLFISFISFPGFAFNQIIENVFSPLATNYAIVFVFGLALAAAGYLIPFLKKRAAKKSEKQI